MFVERVLGAKLTAVATQFPIITLTGPRQSGKTSLVRAVFPTKPYVSLEEPDIRQIALTDPRGFLSNFPQGAILDEIQHVPELFSYIQTIVDQEREVQFVLTGSSNFLLLEKVSQTLAGRAIILQLLPFSLHELEQAGYEFASYEQIIFTGQYPRIYDRNLAPTDFYPSYIQTYVERDVRLIKNITDLNAFIQFSQLCAGRVGQLLNYTSLANDAGISPNTAKTWLSVLEAAYVVYRLYPYHKNFSKRLTKSPKLYFYDTGLACSLLGIREAEQVNIHFLRGALFENLVINEFMKRALHQGQRPQLYFWQDNKGREIDCLWERAGSLVAVEIKSGKTAVSDYFDNLRYWQSLSAVPETAGYVVYGGERSLQLANGRLLSWQHLHQIT